MCGNKNSLKIYMNNNKKNTLKNGKVITVINNKKNLNYLMLNSLIKIR